MTGLGWPGFFDPPHAATVKVTTKTAVRVNNATARAYQTSTEMSILRGCGAHRDLTPRTHAPHATYATLS